MMGGGDDAFQDEKEVLTPDVERLRAEHMGRPERR